MVKPIRLKSMSFLLSVGIILADIIPAAAQHVYWIKEGLGLRAATPTRTCLLLLLLASAAMECRRAD
jgi:hypothetical protein